MATPAPRLHVYLRPGAPTALVIRQGPSRVFCTIGWDLRRDRFTVGQWVKHKLYPERGDLSPDGAWHVDRQWSQIQTSSTSRWPVAESSTSTSVAG